MKSVKITLLTLCFVLISTFAFAQRTKWVQRVTFQNVMSKTFHPAEDGDFQPIKSKSEELVIAAKNWKNSEIPDGIPDKKKVKENLMKLYKDSKILHSKIKKGVSDADLKTDLFALHDTFHTIIGLCNENKNEYGN